MVWEEKGWEKEKMHVEKKQKELMQELIHYCEHLLQNFEEVKYVCLNLIMIYVKEKKD